MPCSTMDAPHGSCSTAGAFLSCATNAVQAACQPASSTSPQKRQDVPVALEFAFSVICVSESTLLIVVRAMRFVPVSCDSFLSVAIRSCQLAACIRPSYLSHAGRCREVAFSAWASDYAAGIGHGSVLHPMRVSLHAISRSRNHDLPRTEAGRAATSAARRSGNCLLRAEPRSERRAQQRHNRNPCFHGFVLFRNQPRSLTVAFTPGGVTSFTRTNLNFRPPDIVLISTRSPFTFVVLPTLM